MTEVAARSLHRLIYFSERLQVPDPEQTVQDIVAASIRNNRADDLTGLLLCCGGWFVQVLEGAHTRVMTAYGRIIRDERHRGSRILASGPAEKRLFGEWNMCASSLAPSDAAIVDTLALKGEFRPDEMSEEAALKLLLAVAAIQRRTALSALVA